jgi:hypothetical protein
MGLKILGDVLYYEYRNVHVNIWKLHQNVT